ncbi:MAG: riboflavin synthase [Planctomycetaceae bacterium]|nr:riboflavin synthase [Planctomycetaceae bacterium]|tara:strand:+ start:1263 stop:1871 length:609 start_codon:yes stop_codon:yes gene_type:complete
MFTGLVESTGKITALEPQGPGIRLVVDAGALAEDVQIGDSIANNGCCLTVIEVNGTSLAFEAGPETLAKTSLGNKRIGDFINLERSLQVGDRLGGHLVTGHVDAVGTLDQRLDEQQWATFWFQVPEALTRQMAPKGSITVEGVSLTLVEVESRRFSVALIPHTLDATTLGNLQPGDKVNLETDLLAKYVEQQMSAWPGDSQN